MKAVELDGPEKATRPAPSAKAQALRHLARREHSRAELERKLLARAGPDDEGRAAADIARALDELAARGLLSDERTAEALRHGLASRCGSRRLKQALLDKGLAPELVAATVQASRGTEFERALALWRRRFGAAPAGAAERARQMRFLAGRGFDLEVVRRVLKGTTED